RRRVAHVGSVQAAWPISRLLGPPRRRRARPVPLAPLVPPLRPPDGRSRGPPAAGSARPTSGTTELEYVGGPPRCAGDDRRGAGSGRAAEGSHDRAAVLAAGGPEWRWTMGQFLDRRRVSLAVAAIVTLAGPAHAAGSVVEMTLWD